MLQLLNKSALLWYIAFQNSNMTWSIIRWVCWTFLEPFQLNHFLRLGSFLTFFLDKDLDTLGFEIISHTWHFELLQKLWIIDTVRCSVGTARLCKASWIICSALLPSIQFKYKLIQIMPKTDIISIIRGFYAEFLIEPTQLILKYSIVVLRHQLLYS